MSKDYSVFHFKKTSSVSDRIEKTKLIIFNLKPTSILDIGGNDYKDFCFRNNISYTCKTMRG